MISTYNNVSQLCLNGTGLNEEKEPAFSRYEPGEVEINVSVGNTCLRT